MTDVSVVLEPLFQTATFERADGRVRARFGLTLENHLDEVWAALTQPEKLVEWLAPGEIDARPAAR